MRKYAKMKADAWFILSAEHGLLRPGQVIAPYERTLKTMTNTDQGAWAVRVQRQLLELLPASAVVVILAGVSYRKNIVPFLESHGFSVEVPIGGVEVRAAAALADEQTC